MLLMECSQGEEYFSDVELSHIFGELPLHIQEVGEVSTGAEVHDQEEPTLCLEGVVQTHDEGVLHDAQYVLLGLGVAHEVLAYHLVLTQDL